MDCGAVDSCNFKRKLGLNPLNAINSKQQALLREIKDTFEGGNMQIERSVFGHRVDLYFHDYKLAVEDD